MKKYFLPLVLLLCSYAQSQTTDITAYTRREEMIPMRDGVKLYTLILSPSAAQGSYPVLMERTPYSASHAADYNVLHDPYFAAMAKEGYIIVFQDIRGKYKSEGSMEIHQPVTHLFKKGTIDESTDTYDAIDWLIKNLPNNNGKAGILGISYPGWLALVGAVDAHPALKAASEQACMGDLFLGDDFHHNGAFRLSYGMEYSYEVEHDKTDASFPFPQYDLYDWYRKLGPLKNVNDLYFHKTIPTWNKFVEHPSYDAFWQQNSTLSYVKYPQIPMLHVGGYFDQEDINGPQLMYAQMEKRDSFHRNNIILGPWNHGQWARGNVTSLGAINFERNTSGDFLAMQKQWFDFYLKGIGTGKFDEANCFQTGTNQWKSYTAWPPKEASIQKLYVAPNHTCSFSAPAAGAAFTSFISNPAQPVPYRQQPIEATYGPGSHWFNWHVDDQRFVYSRPDVVSFMMDTLKEDLIVTGQITAHLFASTTGSDADWIVKLIDVYPDIYAPKLSMSQYQLPVAMEVFRGRFRKSFEHPEAIVPNKPEEYVFSLHQINHVFKKGHRIMVQVQSSWFPVIDRNPQKFVSNIFEAKESDFIQAEHRIYHSAQYATYIELPVMR